MKASLKEIGLFAIMAVLMAAVIITAWTDVPSFTPVSVTYHPNGTVTTTSSAALLLSINSATAEELTQIEGIGNTLAERIVAYREANGGFLSVDELLAVEGVGEKKLEKWRPYLTI